MFFKPRANPLFWALLISLLLLPGPSPTAAQAEASSRLAVSSPIELSFNYPCRDLASVQVVLDDEVKDIIARQILLPDCNGKETGNYSGKIYWDPFERLTPAHLSIGAYDAQTRLIWVQSLDIQFSDAPGPTEVELAFDNPIRINTPEQGTQVSTPSLNVQGELKVSNTSPLNFELVSDAGRIIAAGVFQIPPGSMGEMIGYQVDLPITDRQPTEARLSVMQFGQDIFGIESIQSVYLSIR